MAPYLLDLVVYQHYHLERNTCQSRDSGTPTHQDLGTDILDTTRYDEIVN